MKVQTCDISGLLIIDPKVFGDARGFFLETWNLLRYREAGIAADFVQDNVSFSRRGILRGLHCQNPKPQGKLLEVLQGEVFRIRGRKPATSRVPPPTPASSRSARRLPEVPAHVEDGPTGGGRP